MNCDKCHIFAMLATWKVKLKSGISSAGLCVVVKGDQRQLLSCGKTIKVSRPHPPAAIFLKIKNGTFTTPSSLRGRNTNEIQAVKILFLVLSACFNFFGFRPQSSACAFAWAKLGCKNVFKFIDQYMSRGHPSEVLPCNYNGEISQKIDLVITFDWMVLLT